MYKLCRININKREEIYSKLNKFVDLLKDRFDIDDIYLYGSFSTKNIHEGSDIDLLIVGRFKERFIERIGKITSLTDLPIEPLVYTPEEIEYMRRNGNPFINTVLETGIKL